MQFDEKDVIAVAKSRVSRAEGNKQNYWVVGGVLVMIIGVFVVRYNIVAGWVLVLGGAGVFYWYWRGFTKRQNAMKDKLLKEWQQEQAK